MDFYLANDQGGLLVSSVKNISVDEFDLVCTTDVMGEIPNVREVFLLDYSCRTTRESIERRDVQGNPSGENGK